MRRLVLFTAAMLAGAGAATAFADGINFGLTITGQVVPGVYGHVVIGNSPPPPVVYARPVIIEQPAVGVVVAPIYLHVPPDYARHWRLHCREFHACNRPVYFVRSPEYAPGFNMERWRREHPHAYDRYQGRRDHDHDRGHAQDRGRDHDHDHDHDRHHDHDHDHDHD
ncbi:MAG: hypothetical protein ACREUG_12055 [Steroidobacteraceae bacterium]